MYNYFDFGNVKLNKTERDLTQNLKIFNVIALYALLFNI